jgi:hypothetical protein
MSVEGQVILMLKTRRVFKPRAWLGMGMLKIALWLLGARAEAAL